MLTPPKPLFSPALLLLLARLAWRSLDGARDAAGAELGMLADPSGALHALYLNHGEVWAASAPTAAGLGPFLVSKETAAILVAGKLSTDGALVHDGVRYQVVALLEQGRAIARAVAG